MPTLLRIVAAKFGISFRRVTSPSHAALAQVYFLDDKYVLRARPYNPTTIKEFYREQKLIAAVRHRIPYQLPTVLSTRGGKPFIIYRNRFWTLYPFIPGRVRCSWQQLHNASPRQVREMLRALHILHYRTIGIFSITFPTAAFVKELEKRYRDVIALLSPPVRVRIQKAIAAIRDSLPPKKRCFVHGDFHHGNLLLNSKGRIHALLDLDWCRIGSPLEDLAYTVMMYLRAYPQKVFRLDQNRLTQLLDWYGLPLAKRPLFMNYLICYTLYDVSVFKHAALLPRKAYYLQYQRSMLKSLCESFECRTTLEK